LAGLDTNVGAAASAAAAMSEPKIESGFEEIPDLDGSD